MNEWTTPTGLHEVLLVRLSIDEANLLKIPTLSDNNHVEQASSTRVDSLKKPRTESSEVRSRRPKSVEKPRIENRELKAMC